MLPHSFINDTKTACKQTVKKKLQILEILESPIEDMTDTEFVRLLAHMLGLETEHESYLKKLFLVKPPPFALILCLMHSCLNRQLRKMTKSITMW